jgi:hypothetical protein
MAQPRPACADRAQRDGRPTPVLRIGLMHDSADNRAERVDRAVTHAALGQLSRSLRPLSAVLRSRCRYGSPNGLAPALHLSRRHDYRVSGRTRNTAFSPVAKMALRGREGWKIPRKQALPAADCGDVLDRANATRRLAA